MDPNTPVAPVDNTPPAAPPAPAAPNVKQQIVDYVTNGKSVLVTVGSNPSVDELASLLGLTFLLNKLGKHATAVFSGKIPSAMEFLDPEATFENSVDSLRDFIIALDKEKADKLRYKVEEDVVRIFITPYKTTITDKDLTFSQGDFNVDVVIALGATKREELDKAITSHGRILHDAVVITINAGPLGSNLGVVDWNEPSASSVAEMLVSITEAFGSGLLDEQMSTAFLTGIVAETNRFSNEKTSPKVMTMAAQLMAAGANQQLIATNLRQEGMISEPVRTKQARPQDDDGEMDVEHADEKKNKDAQAGKSGKNDKPTSKPNSSEPVKKTAFKSPEISVNDTKSTASTAPISQPKIEDVKSDVEPVVAAPQKDPAPQQVETPVEPNVPPLPAGPPSSPAAEPSKQPPVAPAPPALVNDKSAATEPAVSPLSTPVAEAPLPDLPSLTPSPAAPPAPALSSSDLPSITPLPSPSEPPKPTFGGTLNATTSVAEEAQAEQAAREAGSNNVALEHAVEDAVPESDPNKVASAREAVEAATAAQPFDPANQPLQSLSAQPLPAVEGVDSGVSSLQASPPMPSSAAQEADASPVDDFMAPHLSPAPSTDTAAADPAMPPLPPPLPANNETPSLPPLPPLPGGNQPVDMAAPIQPQINPDFMKDMPQSANPWSTAAEELGAKQQQAAEHREAKMESISEQYDKAADRNRELQGKPPLNPDPNDHTTFPLPPSA